MQTNAGRADSVAHRMNKLAQGIREHGNIFFFCLSYY